MKKRLGIKGERARGFLVMLLFVGLATACASEQVMNTVWSKPQATQQEFAKDKRACIMEANGDLTPDRAMKDIVENVTAYHSCMERHGWRLKEIQPPADGAGKKEVLIFQDGTKYEGSIVNGKMQGKGTYTWADGTQYEGDWVAGMMHGWGTYTCGNGIKFTGRFEKNKPVDFVVDCSSSPFPRGPLPASSEKKGHLGSYTDSKGNRYEGYIVDGKLHGKGSITSPSGNKYEGDFVNGKIEGWGTYICSNGKKFTGQFKNNKPVGFSVKCN